MNFDRWNEASKAIENLTFDNQVMENHSSCCQNHNFVLSKTVDVQIIEENLKAANRRQNKLLDWEQRADWNESERERRKSQFDMVTLDDTGRMYIQTVNTRKKYGERMLANFENPQLTVFRNIQTEEIAYRISLLLGKNRKEIFLKSSEAGNEKIFLQKLNAAGADFIVSKKSSKWSYAAQLWALLIQKSKSEILIPEDEGWYQNEYGQIKFCKGSEMTWKKIIKKLI